MEVNGIKIISYSGRSLATNIVVSGQYVYDEVHKRHFLIVPDMHGLREIQIDSTSLSVDT